MTTDDSDVRLALSRRALLAAAGVTLAATALVGPAPLVGGA
ncbi:MAG TPA: hypothetical protein VMD91_03365 [Candidatus Sulfotelmatobacter sp.]|nr:hypothetical protein [Candidatus Sulfotelmatobacter sp.]